jgi:hypothetical protein
MSCPCFVFCVNAIDVAEDDDQWWEFMITFILRFMTVENFLVRSGPRNSPEIALYNVHKDGVFHSSGILVFLFMVLCTSLFS